MVAFTDLSTNVPTTWEWSFGDGNVTNSTVKNPIHTYLATGNYTVSLNASNAGGSNISTRVGYINVINVTASKIGTYNPTLGAWYLDFNGDGIFTSGTDKAYTWGCRRVSVGSRRLGRKRQDRNRDI